MESRPRSNTEGAVGSAPETPKGGAVRTEEEAVSLAEALGYPVLVRPSYVIGGQNMTISHSDADTLAYMQRILSGGIDKLTARIRVLQDVNPALACKLADMAYFAAPDNKDVLQASLDAYSRRIVPGVPTQEVTVYLEHMLTFKQRLKHLNNPPDQSSASL